MHDFCYGIAYTSAILSVNYGFSFFVTLPIAMIVSGIIAMVISLIALRTVEDYFIIITLGIQVLLFSVINNWMDLTNGPLGITGIPSISISGHEIKDKISYLILTLVFVLIVFYVLKNITKSPFGRVLIALSEDEIFAKSLGKKVYSSKITSFTVGAMIAAIPGVFYAH